MRIRDPLICVILALNFLTGNFAVNAEPIRDSKNQPANCVIAYYFHGNFRCANCRKIEQYSKEAIEKYFEDELASGKVVFEVINIEEKGNEHFVNDYQLYTRSLVLSLVKDGREIKSKNLTGVWEYLRDKTRFYKYVKDEIEGYLKEL